MSESHENAQHPATAIRLQRASQEGDAPKSYELVASLQLTTGVTVIYFLVSGLAAEFTSFAAVTWKPTGISTESVVPSIKESNLQLANSMLTTLLPILAAILIGSVLSHIVQSLAAFGFKKPIWQPNQINPMSGLKKLFSIDNLTRGILGIPKVVIVVMVALIVVWHQRLEFAELQRTIPRELGSELVNQVFVVLIAVCGTLVAISLFDYLVQWLSFQSRMRMTDQQLRDENRLQSPDPHLKSRHIDLLHEIQSVERIDLEWKTHERMDHAKRAI